MQFDPLNRRDFITLLGGTAITLPLPVRAQPAERMRRLGVLVNLAADDPESQARIGAFLQALQEFGWTMGRNIQIDYRYAGGNADRIRKYAAELVSLAPDVILANGNFGVGPLQQVTRTLPIVFVGVTDPVGGGFVASLARPDSNATGFSNFEYGLSGKWLELLKEIAPRVTRAGVIRDSAITGDIGQLGAIQSVAPSLGIELSPIGVRDRARHNDFRARAERRSHRSIGSSGDCGSRSDHHAGIPTSAARSIPVPFFRYERWPNLLRS